MEMNNEHFVGIRITTEQRDKLKDLAKNTQRTVSGVLRSLIDGATYSGVPDIRQPPGPQVSWEPASFDKPLY